MRNERLSNFLLGSGVVLGVALLGLGAIDMVAQGYPQLVEFGSRYIQSLPQAVRGVSEFMSCTLVPAFFTDISLIAGGFATAQRSNSSIPPEVI